MPVLDISYQGSRTLCGLSCLASSTSHHELRFIRVVACVTTSVLSVAECYSMVWVDPFVDPFIYQWTFESPLSFQLIGVLAFLWLVPELQGEGEVPSRLTWHHLSHLLPLSLAFSGQSSLKTMGGPALPLGLMHEDNSVNGLLGCPPGPGLSLTTFRDGRSSSPQQKRMFFFSPPLTRISQSHKPSVRKHLPWCTTPYLIPGGRGNFGEETASGSLSSIISGPQSRTQRRTVPHRSAPQRGTFPH